MIGNNLNGTSTMQRKLMAAAFATPFALAAGTGGFTHAQPVEATGNSMFVISSPKPTREEIDKARFVKKLEFLKNEFRMNNIQIAMLMQVSRQSVHNWLEGVVDSVKDTNQERLSLVVSSLKKGIEEPLRSKVGILLARRLDRNVESLELLMSQKGLSGDDLDPVVKSLNVKLSGVHKSEALSQALSDKKPLV